MLTTQSVAVLVFMTIPVMATEIAPDFGVEAKDIAVMISIVFGSAMFFSAASGSMIRHYGGIRANQIGMALSAICLLLALPGSIPLLMLAAVLIGMGYGPNTPSGSHVLARVTPPASRGFVFSLKQSGAPLGGMLSGLLVPAMVISIGWRGAIGVSVLIAMAAVIAIQPLRARLDDDRDPNVRLRFASPRLAICTVLRLPALRRLTLVAFFLTAIQSVVMAFLVIYLIEEIGLTFTLAGAIFGTAQAAGAVMRVMMGWLSDRTLGARSALVVLGLLSSCALVSLTLVDAQSPQPLVVAICVAAGCMSFGWNGVFLAEVANLADQKDVGTATGGSLFFIYGGIVFGPIVVSSLITMSGGYELPFYALALLTSAASLNLLWRRKSAAQT